MALQAKALIYPVVIGVIVLALIYIFFSLTGSVSVKESAMFDRLHELKDYSFDRYLGGWDLFILNIFTSAIILLAGGFVAVVFTWRATPSLNDWPKTSFVVACIPAVAIDIYILINWYNQVQIFNSGGTLDGRPFEPVFPPVILLFLVMVMMFCIIFSLAGGRLAREALKLNMDNRGS